MTTWQLMALLGAALVAIVPGIRIRQPLLAIAGFGVAALIAFGHLTALRPGTTVVSRAVGNADGNRHTHINLPVLLAGPGGGAFKPGRYVKAKEQTITNLFLSMADAMGGERIETHGDSTGRFA